MRKARAFTVRDGQGLLNKSRWRRTWARGLPPLPAREGFPASAGRVE